MGRNNTFKVRLIINLHYGVQIGSLFNSIVLCADLKIAQEKNSNFDFKLAKVVISRSLESYLVITRKIAGRKSTDPDVKIVHDAC